MPASNQIHSLLTPENCTVIFIDHQPQMTFGVTSIDRQTLFNNVDRPGQGGEGLQGPGHPHDGGDEELQRLHVAADLLELFPGQEPIERTSMNSWEDKKFVAAVEKTGRKKLVIAALWTEVCLAFPAIQAMEAGYEVYAVEDASGGDERVGPPAAPCSGSSRPGRSRSPGSRCSWSSSGTGPRKETYDAVMGIVLEHSGAYGAGRRVRLHDGPRPAAGPEAAASSRPTDTSPERTAAHPPAQLEEPPCLRDPHRHRPRRGHPPQRPDRHPGRPPPVRPGRRDPRRQVRRRGHRPGRARVPRGQARR